MPEKKTRHDQLCPASIWLYKIYLEKKLFIMGKRALLFLTMWCMSCSWEHHWPGRPCCKPQRVLLPSSRNVFYSHNQDKHREHKRQARRGKDSPREQSEMRVKVGRCSSWGVFERWKCQEQMVCQEQIVCIYMYTYCTKTSTI